VAQRRFRGNRRTSGSRRKNDWRYAQWTGDSLLMFDQVRYGFWLRVPAGELDTLAPDQPQIVQEDCTLVRTRAFISWNSNNGALQVNRPWEFAFGIIAWDGTNETAPIASNCPNPAGDLDNDWLFRSVSTNMQENIFEGTNSGSDVDAYQSRAMRKLSHGTGLLGVVGMTEFTGAALLNVSWFVDVRFLLKLP